MSPHIVITTAEPTAADRAAALAASTGLACADPGPGDICIRCHADHLAVILPDQPKHPFILTLDHLDLRPGSRDRSRRQPLARALGRETTTIVDATAGFGRDALLMAAMGIQVIALERSPLIHALLADAIDRARATVPTDVLEHLTSQHADATAALPQISPPPDAVYLDPMFETAPGSALPRRWAQVLRALLPPGNPADTRALFAVARDAAADRVIIKRTDSAPPLMPGPDFAITGRTTRYDVYLAMSA